MIISLQVQVLLPMLKAPWLRLPVHPYLPLPSRCYQCQFFGHVSRNCRWQAHGLPAIFERCELAHGDQCIVEFPKCTNCRGSNPASSKKMGSVFVWKRSRNTKQTTEKLTFSDRVLTPLNSSGYLCTFAFILIKLTSPPLTNQSSTGLRSNQPSSMGPISFSTIRYDHDRFHY